MLQDKLRPKNLPFCHVKSRCFTEFILSFAEGFSMTSLLSTNARLNNIGIQHAGKIAGSLGYRTTYTHTNGTDRYKNS